MAAFTSFAMVVLALLCLPAAAQLADETAEETSIAVLRAFFEVEAPIVRGQRIDLIVEALTTEELEQAPNAPAPEGDGLIAVGPVDRPTPISDRRDNRSLAGFRWRYHVFPARAGALLMDPISVQIGGETITSPLDALSVMIPDEFASGDPFIAAAGLTVDQRVTPGDTELSVGDAITREITIEAENTVSMLLPVIVAPPIEGLRAYADAPELNDRSSRGEISASRTVRIVYVIEREGDYTLPAIEVAWWDTSRGRARVADAAPVSFSSAALESATANADAMAQHEPVGWRWAWWLAGIAVLLVAMLAGVRRLLPWRRRHGRSAWAHRRQLSRALNNGASEIAVQGIYRYLHATTPTVSLSQWLSGCRDRRLAAELANLLAHTYGPRNDPWDGAAIYSGMMRWQRQSSLPGGAAPDHWRLNPQATPDTRDASGQFAGKRLSLLYD